MANTSFDPFRSDPFQSAQSNSQLVPVEPVVNSQTQKPLPLNEDVLMQFDQQTQRSDVRSTRKRREVSPSTSPKNVRPGTCVLHNPEFAPPPVPLDPKDKDLLGRFQFMAEKEADYRSLPNAKRVTHSGCLVSRISLKSLLTKSTFEEWLYNPYLSKDERANLIKLGIDFKRDRNLPNLRGYQATRIRTKYYKRGGMVHQFKLDRWMTYGPAVAGAFGCTNEKEVNELHAIVTEMLRHHPMNMDFLSSEAALEFFGETKSNTSRGDSTGSVPGFATRPYDGKSVASFIST